MGEPEPIVGVERREEDLYVRISIQNVVWKTRDRRKKNLGRGDPPTEEVAGYQELDSEIQLTGTLVQCGGVDAGWRSTSFEVLTQAGAVHGTPGGHAGALAPAIWVFSPALHEMMGDQLGIQRWRGVYKTLIRIHLRKMERDFSANSLTGAFLTQSSEHDLEMDQGERPQRKQQLSNLSSDFKN